MLPGDRHNKLQLWFSKKPALTIPLSSDGVTFSRPIALLLHAAREPSHPIRREGFVQSEAAPKPGLVSCALLMAVDDSAEFGCNRSEALSERGTGRAFVREGKFELTSECCSTREAESAEGTGELVGSSARGLILRGREPV